MSISEKPSSQERQQTDESLRVEREIADQALGGDQVVIDETADAVISRARERADEVLAAARAKSDRRSTSNFQLPKFPHALTAERQLEDRVLREERADADEILRLERAQHLELLSNERDETDKDLSSERDRSDDALSIRDEFLGIVSHDLRNMLNSIVLAAATIAEGATRPNHAEQSVVNAKRIQRAGGRMSRLIGDLVDVASIEAGALAVTCEDCDPLLVVTEAIEIFQTQASVCKVSLTSEITEPMAVTAFDYARILQVLVNLLSNAIKFTSAGGKVVVRGERTATDLRFEVSDTGVGIPSDKLETIFHRFIQLTQNDRRGLGLGLYISKCIVQGHGGRIWAKSKVGEGSTFYVTLPVARLGT